MTKKSEVASNYGEGDIEAKAMTKADQAGQPTASPARVPKNQFVPASGTTETDVAKNIDKKAARASKS